MSNKRNVINTVEILDKIFPEKHLINEQVEDFLTECIKMVRLYAKKNHDYGDSFTKGMNDIGLAYGVGRLYDKMNRLVTLMKVKAEITDESIEDTIRDLGCYSVMLLAYIKYNKLNNN